MTYSKEKKKGRIKDISQLKPAAVPVILQWKFDPGFANLDKKLFCRQIRNFLGAVSMTMQRTKSDH